MSWYAVDGTTFTVGVIAQQELWSLHTRWHWDPGGFVDDKSSERLVWDPGIEGFVHGGLTQERSIT